MVWWGVAEEWEDADMAGRKVVRNGRERVVVNHPGATVGTVIVSGMDFVRTARRREGHWGGRDVSGRDAQQERVR